MRLAWAFFKRDAAIALSYRIAFSMQFLGNLVLVGLLYYVGKTIGPHALPSLKRYGGNFLAFALVGVALTDCVIVSLVGFASQIREAQTTGTLEATLISPTDLTSILVYSSLWNYFLSAVRFLFYIAVGVMLFGVHLGHVNVPSAVAIFLLTVLCFMGIGILWAGIVLLVKRGDSMMSVAGYVILVATGVFFPVSMLPPWVQKISALIPLTPALEGMRYALLTTTNWNTLAPILMKLTAFAVVLPLTGTLAFGMAVRIAKRTGSLTQY